MKHTAKPWYRARNIAFGVLALVAAGAGWTIFKAVTASPGAIIDYGAQVHALALSHQPRDGADGYPIFARALDIVQKAQERVKTEAGPQPADLERNGSWPIDYSMISDPAVHPLVYQASLQAIDYATRDGLFTELDALAGAPRAVWPQPTSPLNQAYFPQLGQARNLARMGGARMDLAAARGDWDEFARAFEHNVAIARVCDAQGFLISRLVSVAIDALSLGRAGAIVASADVSEAALVRMLAAMDSSASARAPFASILESERLGILDSIQQLFTDDGNGDGTLILTKLRELEGGPSNRGPGTWKIINVAGLVLPGKKDTIAKTDELFTGLKTFAATPLAARAGLSMQPDRWVEELPHKYAALKVLAPALQRSVWSEDRGQSLWNGTRVMLAVEIYKRRHGAYPDSLEQLVPAILKDVPKDSFGGTYRYARLASGQDPTGAAYTLYSIGADGKDDQGAAGKTEGAEYSSTPSGDYRFNAPR